MICIDNNFKKARHQWNCIARLLKRKGANAKCMARVYVTVIQAVLLYSADLWSISKRDRDKLRSFHRRAVRYMCGLHIKKVREGEWLCPDHESLME